MTGKHIGLFLDYHRARFGWTDMVITITNSTNPILIAPCGINCRLCRAYVRDKKACPGCRGDDASKSKSCVTCQIKNCEKLVIGEIEYCFDCDEFPCARLTHLDNRYRTKYGTSPIDNLIGIEKIGIRNFVKNENKKWTLSCSAARCYVCINRNAFHVGMCGLYKRRLTLNKKG